MSTTGVLPPFLQQVASYYLNVTLDKERPYLKATLMADGKPFLSTETAESYGPLRKTDQVNLLSKIDHLLSNDSLSLPKNGFLTFVTVTEPEVALTSENNLEIENQAQIICEIFNQKILACSPEEKECHRKVLSAYLGFQVAHINTRPVQEGKQVSKKKPLPQPKKETSSKRKSSLGFPSGATALVDSSLRSRIRGLTDAELESCAAAWFTALQYDQVQPQFQFFIAEEAERGIKQASDKEKFGSHSLAQTIDRNFERIIWDGKTFFEDTREMKSPRIFVLKKERFRNLLINLCDYKNSKPRDKKKDKRSKSIVLWDKLVKENKHENFPPLCEEFLDQSKNKKLRPLLSVLAQCTYVTAISCLQRIIPGLKEEPDSLKLQYDLASEGQIRFISSIFCKVNNPSSSFFKLKYLDNFYFKKKEGWSSNPEFYIHLNKKISNDEEAIINRIVISPLARGGVKAEIKPYLNV